MERTCAARLSRGLGYGAIIERAVSILAGGNVPVLLLKGTYLAYGVYETPEDRLDGDIDLLVPEASFERATRLLTHNGFALRPVYESRERTFLWEPHPIEIDLHQRLFPRNRFHLPTSDLFARGRVDLSLFSHPVFLPDPYDAYGHLIGHFATSHETRKADRLRRDLERLEKRHSLSPERLALHLERGGLSRAARYAFTSMDPAPFTQKVLANLRPDSMGRVLVDRVSRLTSRLDPDRLAARLGAHLINRSLPHSGFAIGCALLSRAMILFGRNPL